MSRRRRSRTSRQFSQPSSKISSPEVQTAQPEKAPLVIRYAENDNDVIAIHRFLLVVGRPRMLAPVNFEKSLMEIIRVAKEEVAIMAMRGDILVGTMGLIKPIWWYSDDAFLTERWNFVIDSEKHDGAGLVLDAEAKAIARAAGLKFVNQGKIRPMKDGNSYLMFPRVFVPEPDIYSPEGSA